VVTINGCPSDVSTSYNMTNVGIEEENPSLLTVFPNPSNGRFTITFEAESGKEYVLEIFNELGQVVISETFRNGGSISRPVDLGEKASGVYTITLKSNGGTTTKKLVIQR
jgi:hypothetical protein